MGAFAVTKDNTRIEGSSIIRLLKTSHNPTLIHIVEIAKCSEDVGRATAGKINTDEPVTGSIIEILVPGVIKNLRNIEYALGGLLGGSRVVAVVEEALPVSGLDIGGLTR